MKILIFGDIADWNIKDFSIKKIPLHIRNKIKKADLCIYNLEGPISKYGKLQISQNLFWDVFWKFILKIFNKRQPEVFSSKKILKPNGSIFIACSYHNIGESTMSLKANGFEVKNIITWNKSNAMPNLTRRVLTHTTEFIIWAVKGKGWTFNYEKLKEINPDKKQDGTNK